MKLFRIKNSKNKINTMKRTIADSKVPTEDASFEEQIQSLRLSDPDLDAEFRRVGRGTDDGISQNNASYNKLGNTDVSNSSQHAYNYIPLFMKDRTNVPTHSSAALLDEIGGLEGLEAMTTRFYDNVFQDGTIDTFIHSHADPHPQRFAKWIHQKLGGSGSLWDEDRKARLSNPPVPVAGGRFVHVHDRSSAHVAAWHSTKRPSADVGRHFNLEECRVWMRLHLWAMRESGLVLQSPSFADYYIRFIGHFVSVYERTATQFARDSFRWSEDKANIESYIKNGRKMVDVLGLTYEQAVAQIPSDEYDDLEWPYFANPMKYDM